MTGLQERHRTQLASGEKTDEQGLGEGTLFSLPCEEVPLGRN